jgi:CRP-like cAMP-binding protein
MSPLSMLSSVPTVGPANDPLPRADLARNRVLGLLSPQDFALLAPHLRDIMLEGGSVLHDAGDPVEQVYFPHGGMITLFAPSHDADTVKLTTIGREAGIGLRVGLGSRIALSKAVVQVPGPAARVSAARFAEIAEQSRALRRLIVACHDVTTLKVQQSVACNALHDVEGRLCRLLLESRDRLGSDVLPLTQETLAMMLGVRRTTVTIVARMLQTAGLIHYRRGVIRVRDVAGLEESACDCYEIVRHLSETVHAAAEE